MHEPNPSGEPRSTSEPNKPSSPKILRAENLFEGERELIIEHEGERYRLRITRKGKLILQK